MIRTEDLKEKYITNEKSSCVEVRKTTNTKLLKIVVKPFMKSFREMCAGLQESAKKRKEKGEKIDWDTPVDTSNWVKPDEESIRDALLTNLGLCLILKEDAVQLAYIKGKMKILYGLLHSTSPTNPQSIATNLHIDCYMRTILRELKHPDADYIHKIIDEKGDIESKRTKYKVFIDNHISKMITVIKK